MSRKRGKNKPSKSQSKAKADAVPDEVLAEGSGPNEEVEADAQALADAASEALPPLADTEIKEKKTRLTTDAWGQPIEVEEDDEPAAQLAAEIEEEAVAETQAEEQQFEEAVLEAEAAEAGEAAEAVEAAAPEVPDELAAVEAEASADEEDLGAALPTTAATMDDAQLKNLVEALVFAADKPVTVQRLRQLSRVSDVKRLESALEQLAIDYAPRGIALQQVSGGYQFRTNTQYSVWVQQLIAGRPVRLSRAQLETLAIVAYRQPITRPEVDDIRGVDSSATLRLLLDRSLIRVLGKKEDVGRPTLYGTTKEFLDFFSLSDLRELPTLREYSELTAESRKVMSDRLGIDADAIPSATDDEELDADAEAPPVVDQAAEDAAAMAAVAAVTDVYGIEGSTEEPAASSSEAHDATSTHDSESTADVSAAADEAPSEEVVAVEETSSEELAAAEEASSEELAAAEEAPSEELAAAEEAASEELAAAEEAPSEELAAAEEAPSEELAAAEEAPREELVAAEEAASEELVAAEEAPSDDVAAADEAPSEVLAAADEDPSEQLAAAGDNTSASEDLEVSEDLEANNVVAAADENVSAEDEPVSMPRGAAQRDIIGRSTDGDEDPVLRAEAEAELDAASARAQDEDESGSEMLGHTEAPTDDLEAAAADDAAESDETGGSEGI